MAPKFQEWHQSLRRRMAPKIMAPKLRVNTPRDEPLYRLNMTVTYRVWNAVNKLAEKYKQSKRILVDRWLRKGMLQEIEFDKIMVDLQTPLPILREKYNDEYWREKLDGKS